MSSPPGQRVVGPATGGLRARLRPEAHEWVSFWLLVSSYVFGAGMLAARVHPSFVYLTAPHLLFATALLLAAHRPRSRRRLAAWATICGALGWGAEYVGVHGGWLFGEYVYGDVLGPKLRGIPLVLAVNWILVVYCVCGTVALAGPGLRRWARVALAGVGLVALDVLIEPVAIGLDFWTWAAGAPPLRNYLGWWLVGTAQAGLFFGVIGLSENRLAPVVLALQVGFFVALRFAGLG